MNKFIGKNKVWFELIAVLSIGFLPDLYNAILVIFYPELSKISHSVNYLSTFLIIRSITVTIPILYIIYQIDEPLGNFGLPKIQPIKDFLWGLSIFIISYVLLSIFLTIVYPVITFLGVSADTDTFNAIFQKPKTSLGVILLIIGMILNGFAEEFVMRGYLIARLKKLFNSSIFSIVISAIIFASYHIYQPIGGIVGVFGFGIIYGIIYCKIRKVWPLAVAHSIHNIVFFANLL